MGNLSEHFSQKEFECPCCKGLKISSHLIETLEAIRAVVDAPVYIESGYRCPKHNREVGGVKDSGHLTGEAADIYVKGKSNIELANLIKMAYQAEQLPYVTFCYPIRGKTRTRVHIGVDKKDRWRIFGF